MLAEELGYDHIWVYDHVETVPRREPTHVLRAVHDVVGALPAHDAREARPARDVRRVPQCRTACQTGCVPRRDVRRQAHPRPRSAAGTTRSTRPTGTRFPSASERLAILDETLQADPPALDRGDASRSRATTCISTARTATRNLCSSFRRSGSAAAANRKTLRIAARHADATNWQVGIDDFVRKSELLERYCEEAGRPFDAITRTHGPDCRIFDTDAEARAWCAEPGGGSLWGRTPADEYLRENLVGTVEQVTEKTQAFVDAGCSEFVLWMRDYPSDESAAALHRRSRPQDWRCQHK